MKLFVFMLPVFFLFAQAVSAQQTLDTSGLDAILPETSVKKNAAETRRKLLQLAADNKLLPAASYLPFPGVGYVEKDGDGFRFVPVGAEESPFYGQGH